MGPSAILVRPGSRVAGSRFDAVRDDVDGAFALRVVSADAGGVEHPQHIVGENVGSRRLHVPVDDRQPGLGDQLTAGGKP